MRDMSIKVKDFIWKSKKEQVDMLRWMNLGELRQFIADLKNFLFNLRINHRGTLKVIRNRVIWWGIKQPHLIRRCRRSIARAKTILYEKIYADKKYYSQWSIKRKRNLNSKI